MRKRKKKGMMGGDPSILHSGRKKEEKRRKKVRSFLHLPLRRGREGGRGVKKNRLLFISTKGRRRRDRTHSSERGGKMLDFYTGNRERRRDDHS